MGGGVSILKDRNHSDQKETVKKTPLFTMPSPHG